MTAEELIRELKSYPKDAHVYLVTDWANTDDYCNFTQLAEITSVGHQIVTCDEGMDFTDIDQVLLEAEGVDNNQITVQ